MKKLKQKTRNHIKYQKNQLQNSFRKEKQQIIKKEIKLLKNQQNRNIKNGVKIMRGLIGNVKEIKMVVLKYQKMILYDR